MNFGLGCKKPLIEPHLLRTPFSMHAAMRATPPRAFDLRESGLVAQVKDQGSTSSCEGHASSGATETAFALLGEPLGFTPSELDIYRGCRSIGRARTTPAYQSLPALRDDGGQTEDVIAFLGAFGLRPRALSHTADGRNSDCESSTINEEEPLSDLETDGIKLVVGPFGINPLARDADLQVQSAIAAKIPVRVDAFVDTAFENWMPSRPPIAAPNMSDQNGGGHAIYIVGYGDGFFWVRNSWGTGWGDFGDCRVSTDWLRAAWGLYPWAVTT